MNPYPTAEKIKIIIFDVDGVMTDGSLYYASDGTELKRFNVQDGLGIKLLQKANIITAIVTGRNSAMVEKRALELGIPYVIQGREDKLNASLELINSLNIRKEETAYMGDDLPDLAAIKYFGLGITVSNAQEIIKTYADYVCINHGGRAAVREACELILKAQDKFNSVIDQYLNELNA